MVPPKWLFTIICINSSSTGLWTEKPWAVQILCSLLPSPLCLWSVSRQVLFIFPQGLLLPGTWPSRGPWAQRTLASHSPVPCTGSLVALAQHGPWGNVKRGYPDFLPSLHSLLPGPATTVASWPPPVQPQSDRTSLWQLIPFNPLNFRALWLVFLCMDE